MNLEKIHLIKSKDMCLSYYYPTADIRVINKETYDILSAFISVPLKLGRIKN